jgi:hypothetical protein
MPISVRQFGRAVRAGQPAAAAGESSFWNERYLANRILEEDKLRKQESF